MSSSLPPGVRLQQKRKEAAAAAAAAGNSRSSSGSSSGSSHNSHHNDAQEIPLAQQPFVFFVGRYEVSKLQFGDRRVGDTKDMAEVEMNTMVCCGNNRLDLDGMEISSEILTKTGLSEEDIRSVLRDVDQLLKKRSRCCWNWCWLGPIYFLILWLDAILMQCKVGITKYLCYEPAIKKIEEILEEHNQFLKSKRCTVSMVRGGFYVRSISNHGKVWHDTWVLKFQVERIPPV
mmetsp:Transcript_16714/g.24766  ORF Transcript_16714/g.24766 Transcript_16714/m.24766 type:complete len:232 (+) Transcript_16714:727-1422(+)